MNFKHIATMASGQDGAIFGSLLFRFNAKGHCRVYDLASVNKSAEPMALDAIATFTLDRAEEIVPHSNAVMFGTEYAAPGDEFPLLYSNIYNNYAKTENKRKGVCCVYRLQREGDSFKTTLVQLIEIGFTEDSTLWCSEGGEDVRPYGNFAIDRDRGLYWAFVMRDGTRTTRYFSFALPKLADGAPDPELGVNKVVLAPADILSQFDCDYHDYVQGACCHAGKIWSVEGFHADGKHPPAMRVIDTVAGAQEKYIDYRARKLSEAKNSSNRHILVTGLIFVFIGVIFTAIWYTTFYNV